MGVALALPVLPLGLLVGVSRCYLGGHYPGDVAAGWTIASVSTAVVTLLLPLFVPELA